LPLFIVSFDFKYALLSIFFITIYLSTVSSSTFTNRTPSQSFNLRDTFLSNSKFASENPMGFGNLKIV
jgi:hypothetical protein